jgi:hypothetical protein
MSVCGGTILDIRFRGRENVDDTQVYGDPTKKRQYRYAGLVQAGKLSAVVADFATYQKDGFTLAAGMNAANPLGILVRGIVPRYSSDYFGGSYEGVSQMRWPANVQPSTPQGIWCYLVYRGPYRARAAGVWNRGDRLTIANDLGQLASVVTLGLPRGTPINIVAVADDPASNPGDVGAVIVGPRTGAA